MPKQVTTKDSNQANMPLVDYVCGLLQETRGKNIILYGWLNEQNVQNVLYVMFGKSNVIARCTFKNTRYRPDFVIEKHKLIIEFDGSRHYTENAPAVSDCAKDEVYKSFGYNILRIPYFVQIQYTDLLPYLDPRNLPEFTFTVEYPQDFVHPNCALPADFCEAGLKRFSKDLKQYAHYKEDILASLAMNARPDLTLPESLNGLLPALNDIDNYTKGRIERWKYFFKYGLKVPGVNLVRTCALQARDLLVDDYESPDIKAFYRIYKQLKGTKTRAAYEKSIEHLKYLFVEEKTGESYIGSFLGLMLFYYLVGAYDEGERIRLSVDLLAPIT